MKTLIIFGSPRKDGNTASLLKPFMEELKDLGADLMYVDVYEMDIAGCRACLACQDNKGKICCAIPDDMQRIYPLAAAADLIVFAAPIYIWSAPAPVKAVIDRLVYASCKYYGGDPYGPSLMEGKRCAIITTCGYPVEKAADLYAEEIKRFAKHCRASYAGILAERQRNLKDPFMTPEKEEHARQFARELANFV